MSPLEAQIILNELRKLHKRFDESDARMERCFSWTLAVLEEQGDAVELCVGGSEQFGATQPVVADNWSGLFDGDGDSVTTAARGQRDSAVGLCVGNPATWVDTPVLADNWGGLFEQPAHDPEERDLGLSAIDVFGSDQIRHEHGLTSNVPVVLLDTVQKVAIALPHGSKSSCLGSVLEFDVPCPEQLTVDAAAIEYPSTDPDEPTCITRDIMDLGWCEWPVASLSVRIGMGSPATAAAEAPSSLPICAITIGSVETDPPVQIRVHIDTALVSTNPDAAAKEVAGSNVNSFRPEFAQAIEQKQVVQQQVECSGFLVARVKQERHVVRSEVLGAHSRVFVGVILESGGLALCHSVHTEQLLVANSDAAGKSELRVATIFHILFAADDPGLLHCVRLYDGSLDDDPESGVAHFDVPRDPAVGRVGQALAAAAALHADAVGAAGGGQLACVVAAGSAQTTCSTICPAHDCNFPDIPVGALWEEMLHRNDNNHGMAPVSYMYMAELELCNISAHDARCWNLYQVTIDAVNSLEHRYIAKYPAQYTGVVQLSLAQMLHLAPKVFAKKSDQMFVILRSSPLNMSDKRPWPPPSQALVFSEQGRTSELKDDVYRHRQQHGIVAAGEDGMISTIVGDTCNEGNSVQGDKLGLSCQDILQTDIAAAKVQNSIYESELLKDSTFDDAKPEILEDLVAAVLSGGNSHIIHIPGGGVLSAVIFSSTILSEDTQWQCSSLCLIALQEDFELENIGDELSCRMSLGDVADLRAISWPPLDELRLMSCDTGLRPLPWPSYSMGGRCSVRYCCGRLWKLPWPAKPKPLVAEVDSGAISHSIHIPVGGSSAFRLRLSGGEDTVASSPVIKNVPLPFSLRLSSEHAAHTTLAKGNGNPLMLNYGTYNGLFDGLRADVQAQEIFIGEAGWPMDGHNYNDGIHPCVTACLVDADWRLLSRILELFSHLNGILFLYCLYYIAVVVGTASWRAQNSLLHERIVVEVAHIDMTAWFTRNRVSVLVLSKHLASVGSLRLELTWHLASSFVECICPTRTRSTMMVIASINQVDWKIQKQMSATQVWCHGDMLLSIKDLQLPWDPGGTEIFHRLGGKPKPKKGVMSGYATWAYGPDSRQLATKAQGRHYDYKSNSRWMGVGIKQIIQPNIISSEYCSSSPILPPSLYPASPIPSTC